MKPAQSLQELLSYHDEAFVLCAYQTLLRRVPDEAGLKYYLDRVRAGHAKENLLAQMFLSQEYRDGFQNNQPPTGQIKPFWWLTYPFFGVIVHRILLWLDHGEVKRRLRVLENQSHLLKCANQTYSDKIENTLSQSFDEIQVLKAQLRGAYLDHQNTLKKLDENLERSFALMDRLAIQAKQDQLDTLAHFKDIEHRLADSLKISHDYSEQVSQLQSGYRDYLEIVENRLLRALGDGLPVDVALKLSDQLPASAQDIYRQLRVAHYGSLPKVSK
jgi:hypothetical protein